VPHNSEIVLTKCYTLGEMSDDLVIFVKCRSTAEKRALAAAARDHGKSLNRFALESMASCAGVRLDDGLCGHCSALLAKGNRSGFCRKCQRTIGLVKLKKTHEITA
jgi:hypothetical protein